MNLLSPMALWLGVLVAVPLAVHLLRRRTGARVVFPATRYLARAEREHSRRLRLRNLLLMAVRLGLVLALAAAAAGPIGSFPLGAGATGAHAPTAVAIVLDNSLSSSLIVDGVSVLDGLRNAVRSALHRTGAGDRVWLLTVDGDVAAGDRSGIEDALGRVVPFEGRARLDRAVARAVALLQSAPIPERVLVILTDGQASTWNGNVSVAGVATTIFAPIIPPIANRSVVDARAEPARWTPRGAINARIAGADSVTWRIALAGRTLARGTAESEAAVVVTASPGERGWLAGSVEIAPDELRADDVRHFGVWIGAPPAVSLDRTAGPFIASALVVLREASRVTSGNGVSIVAAENARTRPALIMAPSAPVQLGAANRALERAGVPWRFGSAVSGPTSVTGDALAGVEVTLRYKLERLPRGTSDTLAFAGTEPWIVAGDGYVLVGSVMDPQHTTLPVRAAFIPWLADVLTQRLGTAPGGVSAAAPGDRITVPSGADALVAPDGSRVPASALGIDAPRRTGGYRWVSGETTIGMLVVNADSSESRLDRLDARGLASHVQGSRATVVTDAAGLPSALFVSSSLRELAGPLLVLALLLVACEAALARDSRRRAAPVTAGGAASTGAQG